MSEISGMTILGVKQPDFVILAADGKTTWNGQVVLLNEQKIRNFGSYYGMRAGISTEFDAATEILISLNEDYPNNPLKAINAFAAKGKKWEMIMGGFEGGLERNGMKSPFLECVTPVSEVASGQNLCAMGSGGEYAETILREMPSSLFLTVEEVLVWVERALVYAALRDKYSGGEYMIRVIERKEDYEIKGKLILRELWDKHAVYFEEVHNCKFQYLPKRIKDDWIEGRKLNEKSWEDQWKDEQSKIARRLKYCS